MTENTQEEVTTPEFTFYFIYHNDKGEVCACFITASDLNQAKETLEADTAEVRSDIMCLASWDHVKQAGAMLVGGINLEPEIQEMMVNKGIYNGTYYLLGYTNSDGNIDFDTVFQATGPDDDDAVISHYETRYDKKGTIIVAKFSPSSGLFISDLTTSEELMAHFPELPWLTNAAIN